MECEEIPQRRTSPRKAQQVAESKAKRQERQQARFRDRGGIFVPTARNTLADILLGRTTVNQSPNAKSVRARARSRSRSPAKPRAEFPHSAPDGHSGGQSLALATLTELPRKSAATRGARTKKAPSTSKRTLPTIDNEIEEGKILNSQAKRGKGTKKAPGFKAKDGAKKCLTRAGKLQAEGNTQPCPDGAITGLIEPKNPGKGKGKEKARDTVGSSAGSNPRKNQTEASTVAKSSTEGIIQPLEDGKHSRVDSGEKFPSTSKNRTREAIANSGVVEDAPSSRKRTEASDGYEAGRRDITNCSGHVDARPKRRSLQRTEAAAPQRRKRTKNEVHDTTEIETDTRPRKRSRTAGPRKPQKPPEKNERAQKPKSVWGAQANKASSKTQTSKLTRPRKSVLIRIKEPLPPIEDDEPDPINFLS